MSESGVQVTLGPWAPPLADHARALRTTVFIDEQQVPVELEWDADDATAVHAVAYGPGGEALATGRLLRHAPGVARIGRMAVRVDQRGRGIGEAVLLALMAAARARGDRTAVLHAQCSAAGFYARSGFMPHGAVFVEAGIDHIEMQCAL